MHPKMKTQTTSSSMLSFFFTLFTSSIAWAASADHQAQAHQHFLQCLHLGSPNSTSISKVIYTPNNPSYLSVLRSSLQNPRFDTIFTPKPLVIVTPLHESHVKASIYCARRKGLQIRVRSGGHDYEGLSYVSQLPFIIIDLVNLRSITVDVESSTAWVQAGATLGELYYTISERTKALAFPAGLCPPVGVGGHLSGGGYGTLQRKYGLAADNIIDARLMDVNGRVVDRESMGEDLFWALRGGGAASFGVILGWKLKLVEVPPIVTVFTVNRTIEQNATKLVHRWQFIADKLDENLFIRVIITSENSTLQPEKRTVQASFNSLFLGRANELIPLMQQSFPELALVRQDCKEMSWIESVVYFGNLPAGAPIDAILDRVPAFREPFKGKSDFVKKPIPESGLEGMWKRFLEREAEIAQVFLTPYGGRMAEIPATETPFPHRAGNIYMIQYIVYWLEEEAEAEAEAEAAEKYISWMRRLYSYMAPYVTKHPRAAYINYRDLDIGVNNIGNTSYKQASVWGLKYFLMNFKRLVHVKTSVDPANFFRNEQSIPPLTS